MINALIFDFDGVLVLSDGPRLKALKGFAANHGVEIKEEANLSIRGKTTQKVLEEMFPTNPILVESLLEDFKDYRENITNYVEPIAFTVNFIRNYDGNLPIAIASMSSRQTIEKLIKHFGIYEKIDCILSKDEVTHHKPDPEIYIRTADRLKVRYETCLVFEDTIIGVQSALGANMLCSVILNGENDKKEFEGSGIKSFISTEKGLKLTIDKLLLN